MPLDLKAAFEEEDIEKTWKLLDEKFHVNVKKWKEVFEKMYQKSQRELSKMEVFARFGKQYLEEPIAKLVFRDPYYGHTWFELLKYVVRHKLNERKKEASYNRPVKR